MPRHSILSSTELGSLFEIPDDRAFMLQHYTLSDSDKSIVHQHRGASNKLGFAIQLCYMRYPGVILGINDEPFKPLLFMMAAQLSISVDCWNDYGQRVISNNGNMCHLGHLTQKPLRHQSHHGLSPWMRWNHSKRVHRTKSRVHWRIYAKKMWTTAMTSSYPLN